MLIMKGRQIDMEERQERGTEQYKKPELELIPLSGDLVTLSGCSFPAHDPNAGTWI